MTFASFGGGRRRKVTGSMPAPVTPTLTTIVLSGPTDVIVTHSTTAYTAVGYDQFDRVMSGVTFTFQSSDALKAEIGASSGVATGLAAGASSITATSGSVTSNAIVLTVAAQVATTVTVSPSSFSIAVGTTQPLTATVYDQAASPNVISGASVSWSSSDTSEATVDSSGAVTAVAVGSPIITATSGSASGTSSGTVTPSSNPYLPTDTVLIDTRAGKQNDIQALAGGTALNTVLATGGMESTALGSNPSRFINNADLGVRCFAHDHAGFATMTLTQAVTASGSPQTVTVNYGVAQVSVNKVVGVGWNTANVEAVTVTALTGTTTGTITGIFTKNHSSGDAIAVGQDMGSSIHIAFNSASYPRHLFIQWKQRMGKTAGDSGGLGSPDSFHLFNGYVSQASGQPFDPTQSNSNAGRKLCLSVRDIYDQGALDRLNVLWTGSNGSNGGVALDSDGHYTKGSAPYSPNYKSALPSACDPRTYIGQVITQTIEIIPESSLLAADGSIAVTSDDGTTATTITASGVCLGPEAHRELQILSTFNSPQQPQTEYTWDYVVWERPWAGQVPAKQSPAVIGFVSSASTTMTFSVHVPTDAPDTVRFYAGSNDSGGSSVWMVGGSSGGVQIGSDISLAPADAGTTKSITVTGLTPSTTYIGIGCAFGKGGKFGMVSGGLASESTTA